MHLQQNLSDFIDQELYYMNFGKTDGISPSFVTVPVMVLAVELRLLTTLSMVASCFKKNGRITRVYKILEPFHCTGAMHQIRNKH